MVLSGHRSKRHAHASAPGAASELGRSGPRRLEGKMIWRILVEGQEYEADTEMLKEWAVQRRIHPEHYIFHPLLQKWMYAKEVEEIRGFLVPNLFTGIPPQSVAVPVQPPPLPLFKTKYVLRRPSFWPVLIGYWFLSMVGAGILAASGNSNVESGWIIFLMIFLVALCMLTDRGDWNIWQRIAYFIFSWAAQAIIAVPTLWVIGIIMAAGNRMNLIDRSVSFFASIPIVVFAMWHSKLFVKRIS